MGTITKRSNHEKITPEKRSSQALEYEAKQIYYDWLDSVNFCVQKYLCGNFFTKSSDYVEIEKRERYNLTYLNYYFQPDKVYLTRKSNIEKLFLLGVKGWLTEKKGLPITIDGRAKQINKTLIGHVLSNWITPDFPDIRETPAYLAEYNRLIESEHVREGVLLSLYTKIFRAKLKCNPVDIFTEDNFTRYLKRFLHQRSNFSNLAMNPGTKGLFNF